VPRSIHESARDKARSIAKTEAYLVSRRERKKVEMLFAHLKRILRLDRLRLRGPCGAYDEFLLAAAAQNLRETGQADTHPDADHGDLSGHGPHQTPRRLSMITIPIGEKPTSSTQSVESSLSRPPRSAYDQARWMSDTRANATVLARLIHDGGTKRVRSLSRGQVEGANVRFLPTRPFADEVMKGS
jgi:hypothetical protein